MTDNIMPDKRSVRGCGNGCIRCWRNNLKHGNPQAKEWLAKQSSLDGTPFQIKGQTLNPSEPREIETGPKQHKRNGRLIRKQEVEIGDKTRERQEKLVDMRLETQDRLRFSQPDRTKFSSFTGRKSYWQALYYVPPEQKRC